MRNRDQKKQRGKNSEIRKCKEESKQVFGKNSAPTLFKPKLIVVLL